MMLALMVMALIGQQASQAPPNPQPPRQGDIIVEGKSKPKMICTTVNSTGSRVARTRRCVTPEEAKLEAKFANDVAVREGRLQALKDSIACGPPTIKSCN